MIGDGMLPFGARGGGGGEASKRLEGGIGAARSSALLVIAPRSAWFGGIEDLEEGNKESATSVLA